MRRALFLICLIFLLFPPCALAHKVSIYAYVQDDVVHAEGYFASGSRCRDCEVEVLDTITGKGLLEGRTDEEGRFSFRIPEGISSLRLVLHAGAGHGGEYIISNDKIAGVPGREGEDASVKGTVATPSSKRTVEEADRHGMSDAELEEVVGRMLERKLEPLMSEVQKLREEAMRPGLTEILGGIGYIIGLAGLAAYFKSRASRKQR